MTKADLVSAAVESLNYEVPKKDAARVVDAFLSAVKDSLAARNNIEIRGFGSFKVRERKARLARNPRTGDSVRVPDRFTPSFKPSKELKAQVEGRALATDVVD